MALNEDVREPRVQLQSVVEVMNELPIGQKIDNGTLHILQGHVIRLWYFSPSHDRTAYEIVSEKSRPQRYLVFCGCDSIKTRTHHKLADPQMRHSHDDVFLVSDGKEFSIECRECRIEDSYKI